MRETTYSFAKNLFSPDQIKGINEQAKKSFISGSDYLATSAKKSSNVKFLYLGSNSFPKFSKINVITVVCIFTWLKKD